MKNIPAFVLSVIMAAGAAHAQLPSGVEAAPDLGLAVQVDFPGMGNFDLYDYGIIAELQFRDMIAHPWGYLVTIGYGDWSANRSATKPGASLYDFSGSLEVVPFGGSLLFSAYSDPSWSVILEAGLRYMALDSKIKARNADEGGNKKFTVDIDDALLLHTAVTADYLFSPDVIWSFGVGYRYDLIRGDISTEYGTARENIMESFFLETALRLPF